MKLSQLIKLPENKYQINKYDSREKYTTELSEYYSNDGYNQCLSEFEAMDVEIYEEKLIKFLQQIPNVYIDPEFGWEMPLDKHEAQKLAKSIIAALPELIKDK